MEELVGGYGGEGGPPGGKRGQGGERILDEKKYVHSDLSGPENRRRISGGGEKLQRLFIKRVRLKRRKRREGRS